MLRRAGGDSADMMESERRVMGERENGKDVIFSDLPLS